jgi:hypothetical protein
MTDGAPSNRLSVTSWIVLALTIVLSVLGFSWYGASWEARQRFLADVIGRLHGPVTVRFYLQPALALLAAWKDGVRDARSGHKAFFWTALWDPSQERGRLREGLRATSHMALIGFVMEGIYQWRVFDQFYPGEAVMMVLLLAIIPYFVFRWVIEHVARRWFKPTAIVAIDAAREAEVAPASSRRAATKGE